MAQFLYGERIGKTARLAASVCAFVLDETGNQVLLTRRADNGLWCLPGGFIDPGENAAEACVREVWEETGLQVQVSRLIGVYSTPHRITQYADGNRWQFVSLLFQAEHTGGALSTSDETTDSGFFGMDTIAQMPLMETHRERIMDALNRQPEAFIR